MNEVLNWHPRINCYRLENNDLILISEKGAFSLTSIAFPFFNLIDGLSSVDDITSQACSSVESQTKFLYQAGLLKQQNILIQESTPDVYVNNFVTSLQDSVEHPAFNLINVSSLSTGQLDIWGNLLPQVNFLDSLSGKVDIVLVDSLLDTDFDFVEAKSDSLCVVKVSGQQVWALPLLPAATAISDLSNLQQTLLRNNPSLYFVRNLFPDDHRCIPFVKDKMFEPELALSFVDQLDKHLSSEESQLLLFDKDSGAVEHHPVCLSNKASDYFAKQVLTPVVLEPCEIEFNKDGGSRSVCPEVTVGRLKQFVSPITGIITHISELNTEDDKPVKIYATGFFKSPAIKDAHKITNDSFVQSCLGKGVTHIQSQASGLCEAIERYSALYQGNEPLLLGEKSELSKRCYDFQDLVPYSTSQYQTFSDSSHSDSTLKQAALSYNGEAVHWLPVWSLTENEQVYVPLTSCFANIPFTDDQFARWHSNGCAAGNTLEEATLQALFELIERDATAIWWYNRIERPGFDIDLISSDYLALLKSTLEPEHDFWVLDLTHDIGIPVMAAVGRNRKTQGISFGFGCHLQKDLAAQRALTELCQLIPIRDQNGAPFDFDAVEEGPYLFPSNESSVESTRIQASGDIKIDILAVVDRLKTLGLETLVLDYSRDPLPIKTVKVFVPGLCHIWPQFANERLYNAPVQLSWLDKANSEVTINPQALYI